MRKLVLWLALLLPVQAAEISGRIQYTADSPIGAAGITLINQDTGIRHVALSNPDGYYLITGLQPGVYKLMVRKDGFKTLVRMDIKIDVDQQARIDFTMRIGMVEESIVVEAERNPVSTEDASVSTVVDRDLMASLPLNGRGLLTLLEAAPGVVVTPASSTGDSGQFSVSGQRADTNYITVDGISVNGGIGAIATIVEAPNGTVRQSVGGALPLFTAIGSMHDLVSVESLDEFRLQTATARVDSGRMLGGQLALSTRSGTNQVHGAVFEHLRNEALDANDWFANSNATPRQPLRFHDFGGVLGGPIRRNRTFFFFSQESLFLDQSPTTTVGVLSAATRRQAVAVMQPFVNAMPLPNGATQDQTGMYTGPNPDRARVNTTSLRIDHTVTSHLQAFARYNHAPSRESQSLAGNAENGSVRMSADSVIAGLDAAIAPRVQGSLRFGYVTNAEDISQSGWGGFAGADPGLSAITQIPASQADYFSIIPMVNVTFQNASGNYAQHQWNLVGSGSITSGRHAVRFGGDYRALAPDVRTLPYFLYLYYQTIDSFLAAQFQMLLLYRRYPSSFRLHNLSLFAEDTWKISGALTLSAGLRLESNPPPVATNAQTVFASLPPGGGASDISVSSDGNQLWKSGYTHFAPRFSVAWRPGLRRGPVLRAAVGTSYDLGFGPALQSGPIAYVASQYQNMWPWMPGQYQVTTHTQSAPSYTLVSDFHTPHAVHWNATVEQALRSRTVGSISYVGSAGKALLWGQRLGDLTSITNQGFSRYHALQAQLRARPAQDLQLLGSFSWAHSSDNVSNGSVPSASGISDPSMPPASYYGSSDFDVRLSVFAAVAYELPHLHGWLLDGLFRARTGFPLNIIATFPDIRPNLVSGQPIWTADGAAPGGRRLNSGAFSVPSGSGGGSLGRNAITGSGMSQLDVSLQRQFALSGRFTLQVRLEAFNALNHPNFGNPPGYLSNGLSFGRATSMLNSYLGSGGPASGLSPALQIGGPRALQLGLRLRF